MKHKTPIRIRLFYTSTYADAENHNQPPKSHSLTANFPGNKTSSFENIDESLGMRRLIELVWRGAKTSIPLDGASTAIQNLGPSAVNCSRSRNSAAEAVVEKA